MCGIAGSFGVVDTGAVAAMLERIRHRGPDGNGVATAGSTVHGHVRLALVDLTSASAQPFRYRDGLLSFNGEVWNFRELRSELCALGHEFTTTGDTEVLAAALVEWGVEEALRRVVGMFAFAWSRGDSHVLARDRYGKIPLYVLRHRDGTWEWASERKAWLVPRSGAAQPLPPGCVVDLTTGTVSRWYSLPRHVDTEPAALRSLLEKSVRARLAADAPVCVLISGGLDSSIILAAAAASAADVTAYTAVYDEASEDLAAARRLCAELGVPLREVRVVAPDAVGLRRAVHAIEIASKAQTEIAMMCLPLAERIARDGFKACLTGEGADELFGGYGNMCIAASKGGDDLWREIRVAQLDKMARGNFVRCNKVFMAHGVEARLPFLDPSVVELALSLGKADCPPGKGRLKQSAEGLVPKWVIKRQKDTFQGASGMAAACAKVVASPTRFYNAEARSLFGSVVMA